MSLPLFPDRRFLLAAGEITRFFSEQAAPECRAEFQDAERVWEVQCGRERAGSLPERPDFSDYRNLLASWADRVSVNNGIEWGEGDPLEALAEVDAAIARLAPGELTAALQRLDEQWMEGKRHSLLLERAARGLVLLTLQSGRHLELDDELTARSVAFLVLAGEGWALGNLEAEEALLAHQLGYQAHAREAAFQLPEGHPIRHYVLGSLEDLQQAAEQANQSDAPLVRYLHLRRLGEANLAQDWAQWAELHFPGLAMALAVLNSRPETGLIAPRVASLWERTLDLTQLELGRAIGGLNPDLELFPSPSALAAEWQAASFRPLLWQGGAVSASRFEDQLEQLQQRYTGPFLQAPALQSYLRSSFYPALYRLAEQALGQQACPAGYPLQEPLPLLQGQRRGEPAERYQSWYRQQLERLSWDRSEPPQPVEGLQPDQPGFLRAVGEFAVRYPSGGSDLIEAVEQLAARLDSRPSHRPVHCRLRHSLGLRALLQERFQEASAWTMGLEGLGCADSESSGILTDLARLAQQNLQPDRRQGQAKRGDS